MPKQLPDQPLVVGDTTYTLRFSLKAYMALQEHYDLPSIQDVAARLSDASKLGIGDIVAMLWAGLRRHHPEITFRQAEDMADDLGLPALMAQVMGAFGAALGEAEPEGERAAGPQ